MDKILVLHHNDRDGYVSAAIVGDFFENYAKEDYNITYIEMDYSKTIEERLHSKGINPDDYYLIYLVDYSISNMDNCKFITKYRNKVVWIDHHKSSFDFMKDIECNHFSGIKCIGASGALLTWIYFHEKELCRHLRKAKYVSKDELAELIQKDKGFNIPMLVWYTHRYDIWDISDDVEAFNFGQYKIDINHYLNWLRTYKNDMEQDNYIIQSNIEQGFNIRAYMIECNEKHISQFGIPFVLKYKGKEYDVMMVNMPQPSSLKFGKYAKEYDILLPFYYNGEGCTYSMYKTDRAPEELDVSEIACSVFNGGGHKNAAGFYIPQCELQLRPTKNSYLTIE